MNIADEILGELAADSPVIIVTASPSSDNAIAALRLGAFDFIVKGFKNEAMLATVARAIERRRLVMRDRALVSQLQTKIQPPWDALLGASVFPASRADRSGSRMPAAMSAAWGREGRGRCRRRRRVGDGPGRSASPRDSG